MESMNYRQKVSLTLHTKELEAVSLLMGLGIILLTGLMTDGKIMEQTVLSLQGIPGKKTPEKIEDLAAYGMTRRRQRHCLRIEKSIRGKNNYKYDFSYSNTPVISMIFHTPIEILKIIRFMENSKIDKLSESYNKMLFSDWSMNFHTIFKDSLGSIDSLHRENAKAIFLGTEKT